MVSPKARKPSQSRRRHRKSRSESSTDSSSSTMTATLTAPSPPHPLPPTAGGNEERHYACPAQTPGAQLDHDSTLPLMGEEEPPAKRPCHGQGDAGCTTSSTAAAPAVSLRRNKRKTPPPSREEDFSDCSEAVCPKAKQSGAPPATPRHLSKEISVGSLFPLTPK